MRRFEDCCLLPSVGGAERDFVSVKWLPNVLYNKRAMLFKQDKLLVVFFHLYVHTFGLSVLLHRECLCTNVAPVHAPFYLILLVAVFVCVVPGVQLVLSVLRYSITGSPIFCCAQVSPCCDWDVCISHTARRPVIMFLVYQIEARPAVHSHSHLTHTYTHTRRRSE